MFFPCFYWEKLWVKNFSCWMSVKQLPKWWYCKLQTPTKGGNFGMKLAHLCGFWLDVSFSSHVKNIICNSDWRIIFLMCEKHRSLLWLSRAHWHMKIYNIAFQWVYLSICIIFITGAVTLGIHKGCGTKYAEMENF